MKRLLLLATGGTIAGCADDSATLNNYTAGVLGGDALLAAVPQLQELAAISVEQVANVDSADLLFAHWRALVVRIRAAFAAARMRPTSARQCANSRSALSTLAICSTLIAASSCSCGTAANRASPPSTPAV